MRNLFTHNRSEFKSQVLAWFLALSLVIQNASLVPLIAYANSDESTQGSQSSETTTMAGESSSQVHENSGDNSEHNAGSEGDSSPVDNVGISHADDKGHDSSGRQDDEHSSLDTLMVLALSSGGHDNGNNAGGRDAHKVEICHIPQGNPENAHTIDVDEHSVNYTAHLKHGDSIGACLPIEPPEDDDECDDSGSETEDDDCDGDEDDDCDDVVDENCGNDTHKVQICHIPEGNPENAHTIEVDSSSVSYTAHLAHGDTVGECHSVPPPPPPPPTTTELSCEDVTGEGWYGSYYNYSRADDEMNLPQSEWGVGHADPKGALWSSDWYSDSNYRFDRIDANLMFGNEFFPFDGARSEETDFDALDMPHDYHFGAKWSGYAKVATPGDYSITLTSDDDSWIYVDGVLAVDNSGVHAVQTKTATLALTGKNKIEVYFAERHITGSYMYAAFTTPGVTMIPMKDGCREKTTIVATKVVCDTEAMLPNWGLGGANITRTTATDYVASHEGCHLAPDWKFQWGFSGVSQMPADFVGEANGTGGGSNTGTAAGEWKTFGPTDANGVTEVSVMGDTTSNKFWIREVLNAGYIPFTFDGSNQSNDDNKSAEMYCASDVLNYDNFDNIASPVDGATYYCVAFNALKENIPPPPPANTPPVITVVGANPAEIIVGSAYADQGATVADQEDGQIDFKLVTSGTVNTSVVGTYVITYNATDSQALAAITKTRTVNVVAAPACNAPLDVMVVIDRSGSMNDDGTSPEQPLTDARLGANTFIDTLSDTQDKAGVVSFSTTATLNSTLSSNFAAVKTSYASITAGGYTNTGLAIETASDELVANGRTSAKKVIVLLSDGVPNVPDTTQASATADALAKATLAKNAGQIIYTIGLGEDVNTGTMTQIASTPSHYFFAPSGAQLEGIYRAISTIECQRDPGTISGMKINDRNANGIKEVGENGIAGWSITLSEVGSSVVMTQTTNAQGEFTFANVVPGNYTLCEVNQSGWRETAPTSANGCYVLNVDSGAVITGKDFLNTESEVPECRDGKDNDGDLKADYPADTGCDDPEDNDENTKPIITVVGTNPITLTLGSTYTDQGATALDVEDGVITSSIITANTVNTTVVGSYTVTYNVTDSKGLAADQKIRTVKVASACSDGVDNDSDGKTDFGGDDAGCDNPEDNDENNKPVITVIGTNPLNITIGTVYVDAGATALDVEDGVLTPVKTGTVNTAVLGSYTIFYDVSDSKGLAADQKSRQVNVVPVVTECNDNIDNDGDNRIDFDGAIIEGDMAFAPDLGCDSPEDNDENDAPIITVVGSDPVVVAINSTYVDGSATVADAEDGNITSKLVTTGTVNTAILGNYTITYNATDSQNLAAVEKTRVVKVTSSCSDGRDNDEDGSIDFPADTGCDSPEDNTENAKPVITLLGEVVMSIVLGSSYTEPSATVADQEDGNISNKLVTTGTVDTTTVGTYTITYNATDSQALSADTVTRTVNVTPAGCTTNCGGGSTPPVCSDGGDNDGDGLADYPRDPGCDSPQDNDERDIGPTLTLLGANPMTITQGNSFTDPGATAQDPEEGDVTSRIVVTGSVNGSTVGAYTLTYNVSDSQNHAATPVNRIVNVVPGGGGGGGGSNSLTITNEKLTSTGSTTVVVTWNTNLPATSRVVYGLDPVATIGSAPLFGYGLSNTLDSTATTTHTMTIEGIPSAASAYFRPISTVDAQQALGIELTRGGVLGDADECFYLKEYMRLGYNNNPIEVTKLQSFLRNFEGFDTLTVTGFFDITTDKAVRAFQDKYQSDVLTPWNLPANTGYVYYTTQKKINEIYCQRAFPLTAAQVSEVMNFRQLIVRSAAAEATAVAATNSVDTTKPLITVTPIEEEEGSVAGASTVTSSETESTVAATEVRRGNGRIALADLLATSPKMGDRLTGTRTSALIPSTEDETIDEGDAGVVAVRYTADETTAAVGASGGKCLMYSCVSISIGVLFLIIILTLAYLYVRGGKEEDAPQMLN